MRLLSILLLVSLVFLALQRLLLVVGLRVKLIAALIWLIVVLLLFFQTSAFVELFGLLEELVEVKLSNDVFLGMEQLYIINCVTARLIQATPT